MPNCAQCQSPFEVSASDRQFYADLSPVFNGQKFLIPDPLLCPPCRQQRRIAFRNERHLYHRKSNLSGKQIVSMYAPDKSYKVYDQDEWWGDQWDAMAYGRDFDFSRTFTEQFRELNLAVPHISLYTREVENSYYTNFTLNLKNSYLVFGGALDENCLFAKFVSRSKDVVDALSLFSCELCYEGIASQGCYRCQFFMNCRNCSDCLMVEDCQSCQNCMLCFGLRNKEYCFMNEFVGKEKYEQIQRELSPLTHAKIALLWQKLDHLKVELPHMASHMYASENCTGDMIFNSKGCFNCFDITECEDSRCLYFAPKSVRSFDCTFAAPDGVHFCYNTCSTISTRCMVTFLCWYDDRLFYSLNCASSQDCFGCVGLKNKRYCIFNRQYTQSEYEKLAARIVGHMQRTGEWGEYFKPELSHHGYNETIANEYFPLTREEALAQGWNWHEEDKAKAYKGPTYSVPESIGGVTDDICQQILICETTGKPYKLIPQELKFYREQGLPVPRLCPDARHANRLKRKNPYQLWKRECAKCQKSVSSNYALNRPETVLCEACYLKTVY